MTPEDLLALGWHLLPIRPGTKIPLDGQGLDHATDDPATIARWQAAGCDWAVACEASGLVVIDVDPRHGGDETFANLMNTLGLLPEHPWQDTRSGGSHHLLRDIGKLTRGQLGPGVDVKRRGYILVDPSSGYKLHCASVAPPDPPPQWLEAMAKPAPPAHNPRKPVTLSGETTRYGAKALDAECEAVAAECEGNRNNRLNTAALALGALVAGGEIASEDAEPALLQAAVAAGLSETEAQRTIASGFRTGLSSPRSAPERPRKHEAAPHLDEPPPIDDMDDTGPTMVDLPGPDIPGPDDWRRGLTYHRNKADTADVMDASPGNLAILLLNDPHWVGTCCYDTLSHCVRWRRSPPEIPGIDQPEGKVRDSHFIYVQQAARRQWGLKWSIEVVAQAIHAAAEGRPYHPVRAYLRGLEWDGKPRLDTWLTDYAAAPESPAPVGRWWMISAVARAMQPGVQVDHVLVLQGPQGCRKSTTVRILAGEWYCGTLGDLRTKDSMQNLLGSWIIEIGELDALKGAASTRVKDFISQTVDSYRPAYGRETVERPRGCVFCATTNESQYLLDSTGSRRFWSVKCRHIDTSALQRDRDQLWAEAMVLYLAGEPWWPSTQEHVDALEQEAEDRFVQDPWEEKLEQWLGQQMGTVTIQECLSAVNADLDKCSRHESGRVAAIMRRCGWTCRRSSRARWWERTK